MFDRDARCLMSHPALTPHNILITSNTLSLSSIETLKPEQSLTSSLTPALPSQTDLVKNLTHVIKGGTSLWIFFCLDLPCAERLPPLTVANPKGHHHSLLFLPRPLLVPCDACGLVDVREPSYACFQCNYMAHQSCIDLPRVIKITRHPHRLHYIPYRSPLSFSCRICYKDVDIKYGQYSCNQEDCSYVVHSRCAMHVNVWDGTDLEWQPEDSNEEDIASFKNLGNGVIDHFGHEHLLELKKHDGVGDTDKQSSTGFRYRCSKEGCSFFSADVRCISVKECFIHKSHDDGHPVFLSTSYSGEDVILCKGCKKRCLGSHLHCAVCEYALCYPCATIPDELHYEYDKHPLTLSYGEEKSSSADDVYWCKFQTIKLQFKESIDFKFWFCLNIGFKRTYTHKNWEILPSEPANPGIENAINFD
ncbi:hypothetical protein N665_2233s0004 [Sinapis alba]|nr:hypothetical protein N665_2233s0004 [Sinapis alba]